MGDAWRETASLPPFNAWLVAATVHAAARPFPRDSGNAPTQPRKPTPSAVHTDAHATGRPSSKPRHAHTRSSSSSSGVKASLNRFSGNPIDGYAASQILQYVLACS